MALHNAMTVLLLTTRVLWQCKSCTGEPKRDLALVPKAEAGRFARRPVTTAREIGLEEEHRSPRFQSFAQLEPQFGLDGTASTVCYFA
jgi:hypothetical protein